MGRWNGPSRPAYTRRQRRQARCRSSTSPGLPLCWFVTLRAVTGLTKIKFDGYRMLARVENGTTTLITRNGHDWTSRMPRLRKALASIDADNLWLDAEAVVLDASGKPDFNALQNAFDRRRTPDLVLFVFDLL